MGGIHPSLPCSVPQSWGSIEMQYQKEEMQFKVQEQCSTSILQTSQTHAAIRCFSISSAIHHPYGELPSSSARKTPQKPYFFRSQENQFGFQNTLQMKSHILIQP
jgi:hypothetical protein